MLLAGQCNPSSQDQGFSHQRAMLSPQILFISRQIDLDAPIQSVYLTVPPSLSSRLPSVVAKAYADELEPVNFPITLQSRYESGFPTVTATTITAIRTSKSTPAKIRNGRILSTKRITVKKQYRTAMQV